MNSAAGGAAAMRHAESEMGRVHTSRCQKACRRLSMKIDAWQKEKAAFRWSPNRTIA
jgi:hypothetical protein